MQTLRAHPLIPLLCLTLVTQPAAAQDVRPAEVRQSIRSAIHWLKGKRSADGHWPYAAEQFQSGADALVVLSLLHAGVPANDASILPVIRRLAGDRDDFTYNIALKIAVLALADPRHYRPEISRAAQKLVRSQLADGSWTYAGNDVRGALGRGDNSNTQFALLGLHEAARAGERINPDVWRRAMSHWQSAQQRDGGWGYTAGQPASRGSMTAAGVASLLICGEDLVRKLEHGYDNGAAHNCGSYGTSEALARGLNWLAKNFDARLNPGVGGPQHYWLYAVERAGMLSGLKFFGLHDWYREGAATLVGAQRRDGSWNGDDIDTAFALLFLAKGRKPVLLNKLAWSNDARCNPDRHDAENLTAFLGDKLGEPVAWQLIALDAPLEQWLEAPLLYMQGHEFPNLTKDQQNKLRRYVEAGGTLFAEACCSRPAFREGFDRFVRDAFPEYPLADLEADHPVWSSLFKLKPGPFRLLGLDVSCRTSVIYAPTDLSCLWEQANVPTLSTQAFKLGVNIAAYAAGRGPLRDRLDVIVLPETNGPQPPPAAMQHGALQLVQLIHAGDWRPDADVLPKLSRFVNESASADVVTKFAAMRADDEKLLDHPIAYMSGHYGFSLTAAERDGLQRYLTRGGFLFADACCGRRPFDQDFRLLVSQLFPAAPLTPLPADHAIYAGKPGFDLHRVAYREIVRKENPTLDAPRLEGVTLDGRLVLLYSPYALGCGIDGHPCFTCRGLDPPDARKLAANIVLYALTH